MWKTGVRSKFLSRIYISSLLGIAVLIYHQNRQIFQFYCEIRYIGSTNENT